MSFTSALTLSFIDKLDSARRFFLLGKAHSTAYSSRAPEKQLQNAASRTTQVATIQPVPSESTLLGAFRKAAEVKVVAEFSSKVTHSRAAPDVLAQPTVAQPRIVDHIPEWASLIIAGMARIEQRLDSMDLVKSLFLK
jgi:hypothetical protein